MKTLYDKNTYTVILNTIDEDPSTCTYEVTCDLNFITITQDPTELNKFTIFVGELPDDNNAFTIFEFKVTDENNNENITKQYVVIERSIKNDTRYYNKVLANTLFVELTDYEDENILEKIKNVDGSTSGLNVKTIKGHQPSQNNLDVDFLPVSDLMGKFSIQWFYYLPIIDKIAWDNEFHEPDSSYVLTITASDPQSQVIFYELTCNNPTVIITPDAQANKFNITYPDYDDNVNVIFFLKIFNETGLMNTFMIRKSIYKYPGVFIPIISDITWDNYNHIDNNTYTMNINASDPQGQILTYEVTCDELSVSIVQDGFNDNIFYVTYPDYTEDKIVKYTIKVTNVSSSSALKTDIRAVLDVPISGNRGIIFGGKVPNIYITGIDYITISTPGNAMNFGNLSATTWLAAATSNGIHDRGINAGGEYKYESNPTIRYDTIEYITISTPGNTTDFGDLSDTRCSLAACSNGVNERGVFGGGNKGFELDIIEYITIPNTGNTTNFGDLSRKREDLTSCSNATNERGIFGGGYDFLNLDIIDYITISTTGNAANFGDLTNSKGKLAACSNGIYDRGLFGGGIRSNSRTDAIDYITISTLGNAYDFGDLTSAKYDLSATSNGTNDRGVFAGGYSNGYLNIIDYVTISNVGNAADFGLTNYSRTSSSACSDG